MNIAITGASSFVGTNIIKHLQTLYPEASIYAIVRPNSPNTKALNQFQNLNIVEIDLSEIGKLDQYITNLDVLYLNAWRGTRGQDRLNENMQKSNYIDTMNAVSSAIRMGVKTIIGVGSQAEYGITYSDVTEEYPAKPNTAYGVYKLKTYNEAYLTCLKSNVHFKWGRIFSAYGEKDYEKTLVMSCITKMQENKPVDLSPCTQMWNYINIYDVAEIFARMIQDKIPSGAYNLASDDTRVLKDYVLEIKNELNSESELNFGAIVPNGPLMNLLPINTKIKNALGSYEFMTFEEGINRIIKSLEN